MILITSFKFSRFCLCHDIPDEVYLKEYTKGFESCLCVYGLGYHQKLCLVSVHREGVNPNSMDGVPDLHDHNSFLGGK